MSVVNIAAYKAVEFDHVDIRFNKDTNLYAIAEFTGDGLATICHMEHIEERQGMPMRVACIFNAASEVCDSLYAPDDIMQTIVAYEKISGIIKELQEIIATESPLSAVLRNTQPADLAADDWRVFRYVDAAPEQQEDDLGRFDIPDPLYVAHNAFEWKLEANGQYQREEMHAWAVMEVKKAIEHTSPDMLKALSTEKLTLSDYEDMLEAAMDKRGNHVVFRNPLGNQIYFYVYADEEGAEDIKSFAQRVYSAVEALNLFGQRLPQDPVAMADALPRMQATNRLFCNWVNALGRAADYNPQEAEFLLGFIASRLGVRRPDILQAVAFFLPDTDLLTLRRANPQLLRQHATCASVQ